MFTKLWLWWIDNGYVHVYYVSIDHVDVIHILKMNIHVAANTVNAYRKLLILIWYKPIFLKTGFGYLKSQ